MPLPNTQHILHVVEPAESVGVLVCYTKYTENQQPGNEDLQHPLGALLAQCPIGLSC